MTDEERRIKAILDHIKANVKLFLMSRYVVCSGDQYRLNADDRKRLDEILDGRDLRDDEDPYKVPK